MLRAQISDGVKPSSVQGAAGGLRREPVMLARSGSASPRRTGQVSHTLKGLGNFSQAE